MLPQMDMGNKTLKELIEANPRHSQNFQFSILMLLPRTITADEAIKKEKLFKNKLGTNAFGLNNKLIQPVKQKHSRQHELAIRN